jgi:hypothetical protein
MERRRRFAEAEYHAAKQGARWNPESAQWEKVPTPRFDEPMASE